MTKRELIYRHMLRVAAEAGTVQQRDVIVALGGRPVLDTEVRSRKWNSVMKVFHDLMRAGHLEAQGRRLPSGAMRSDICYALTPTGQAAATAVAAGLAVPAVVSDPPTWTAQLWQSARILRRFTVLDLLPTLTETVTRDRAYRYVRKLVEAGAVAEVSRKKQNGVAGSQMVYRVVRDVVAPPVGYGPSSKRTGRAGDARG